mmetsp:Transcript_67514/g.113106  ORF Transcript_67514/g.113106 Transcript_67514/m.113106 type:complete len:428 (-) Transcript_67514:167-1450(-)
MAKASTSFRRYKLARSCCSSSLINWYCCVSPATLKYCSAAAWTPNFASTWPCTIVRSVCSWLCSCSRAICSQFSISPRASSSITAQISITSARLSCTRSTQRFRPRARPRISRCGRILTSNCMLRNVTFCNSRIEALSVSSHANRSCMWSSFAHKYSKRSFEASFFFSSSSRSFSRRSASTRRSVRSRTSVDSSRRLFTSVASCMCTSSRRTSSSWASSCPTMSASVNLPSSGIVCTEASYTFVATVCMLLSAVMICGFLGFSGFFSFFLRPLMPMCVGGGRSGLGVSWCSSEVGDCRLRGGSGIRFWADPAREGPRSIPLTAEPDRPWGLPGTKSRLLPSRGLKAVRPPLADDRTELEKLLRGLCGALRAFWAMAWGPGVWRSVSCERTPSRTAGCLLPGRGSRYGCPDPMLPCFFGAPSCPRTHQ